MVEIWKPMKDTIHLLVEQEKKYGSIFIADGAVIARADKGRVLDCWSEDFKPIIGCIAYFQPAKYNSRIIENKTPVYVLALHEDVIFFYWNEIEKTPVAVNNKLVVIDYGFMRDRESVINVASGLDVGNPDRPCSLVRVVSSACEEIEADDLLIVDCMVGSHPFELPNGIIVNVIDGRSALAKVEDYDMSDRRVGSS